MPADVTWPSYVGAPSRFTLRMEPNIMSGASMYGGIDQVLDLLDDRWHVSMTLPERKHDNAAALDAFINSLRGSTRTVALWHMARPALQGTLAGSRVLADDVTQGASSIVVTAGTGQTVKAGDMLGVDGLLLQASADAAESGGEMVVPLANRVRRAVAAGGAITLTQPTAPFRLVGFSGMVWRPGRIEAVDLDFQEFISP